MNHIDETTIHLFALEAPEVEHQREDIESHLRECEGCLEIYSDIKSFYKDVKEDVEQEQRLPVLVRDQLPAINARYLEEKYRDHPIRRQFELTIPLRIARWVFKHPYVSVGSGVGTLGLAAALLVLTLKPVVKDRNPSYARPEKEFLVAYNKEGDELWRKHIGIGYDVQEAGTQVREDPERVVKTINVDGNGDNEVISIFGWSVALKDSKDLPLKNTIVCYNADGKERWKYEYHRQMTFGKDSFADDYIFNLMLTGDFDRDGKVEVIAEASQPPWSPNVIVKLNASAGTLVSEYWSRGAFDCFAHKDIDGDGIEEIIFGGQNNSYRRGCLAVFDPRYIKGHVPLPDTSTPEGVAQGMEKYYVMLPLVDLEGIIIGDVPNEVLKIDVHNDGSMEIQVMDKSVAPIIYDFDSAMRCQKVRGSATFEVRYRKLESEGKITRKLDNQYYDELRKGILYWDGEKFVSEPTMNKRYVEAMKKSSLP